MMVSGAYGSARDNRQASQQTVAHRHRVEAATLGIKCREIEGTLIHRRACAVDDNAPVFPLRKYGEKASGGDAVRGASACREKRAMLSGQADENTIDVAL